MVLVSKIREVKERFAGVLTPGQFVLFFLILLLWAYTFFEYVYYTLNPIHLTQGRKVDEFTSKLSDEELRNVLKDNIYPPGSGNGLLLAAPTLTGNYESALVPTDGSWWEYITDEQNQINEATFVEKPITGLTLEDAILKRKNGKICSGLTREEVVRFLCQRRINSNDAWAKTITIDSEMLRAGRSFNDSFGQKGYFNEHTPDFHPMYVQCLNNMVVSAGFTSKPSIWSNIGLDFRLPVNEDGDRINIDGMCR